MQCLKLKILLWLARSVHKIGKKLIDFGLPYLNVEKAGTSDRSDPSNSPVSSDIEENRIAFVVTHVKTEHTRLKFESLLVLVAPLCHK